MIESVKTAVVMVLFYPDEEVIENIGQYCDEVDTVYLVDNSPVENENFKDIKGTKYMPMLKNLGLCEGLNVGLQQAIKDGCTILITMNQDTYCPKETVNALKNEVMKNPQIVYGTNFKFIYRDADGNRIFSDENAFPCIDEEVLWTITAGSAFTADAFNSINGFDNALFIDNLDRDFCVRMRLAGFKIQRLGNTFIYQEPGNTTVVNILIKKLHVPNLSPLRYYYIFRNELYLRRKYKKLYNPIKVNLFKYLVSIVFFEKNKIKKLRSVLRGMKDVHCMGK